jgi:hypothetical protein
MNDPYFKFIIEFTPNTINDDHYFQINRSKMALLSNYVLSMECLNEVGVGNLRHHVVPVVGVVSSSIDSTHLVLTGRRLGFTR